jgi:hypothetical protein
VEDTLVCQGRALTGAQRDELRVWIDAHPDWSRKRLARELCRRWNWRDERGRLKDFAARSLLLKLAARGQVSLPPLRVCFRRVRRAPTRPPEVGEEPPPVVAPLPALQPIQVGAVIPGTAAARRWAWYLAAHHYLGWHVIGENLGYLASDVQGRDLACLLFGAPAWRCAPRDRALGWSAAERRARLGRWANNTRFLILPWVRVPHLASHLLGRVARRIGEDWQAKYGHGLEGLETFVEHPRFAGTCYRAANWQCVGQTTGRSRQDRDHTLRVPVKRVYLYRLRP